MATRLIINSIPHKTLSESIASDASDFKLNNIEKWNGDDLDEDDFGTYAWATFRDSTNTKIEIMRIDPSTIADSAITITKRGLAPEGGNYDTEVSALKSDWNANETTVELGSNPPQIYNEFARKYDAETITAVYTFTNPNIPTMDAYSAPTADEQLATKKYVDDVAAGGTASINRIVVAGTAGETVAAGNLIYFDTTQKEWMKCDADTATTVDNVLLGIAQGAGTNGATISGGVLLWGLDSNQTGLTVNIPYYASNTAGGISSTAGTTEVSVGISQLATTLYFMPRYNQQITENIQDALAGTSGTPSSSNKYVTADDVSAAGAASKIVRGLATGLIPEEADRIIGDKLAGETIADRDAVYMDDTENEWMICDGNVDGKYRFDGFALEAGSNGVAMKVQTSGICAGFSGLDIGKPYFLSDTAGSISTTAGTVKSFVGIAVSATEILIGSEHGALSEFLTVDCVVDTGNVDTVIHIPKPAKGIQISYRLNNNNVTSSGFAVWNATTLIYNKKDYQNLVGDDTLSVNDGGIVNTAPTLDGVGGGGGLYRTMTVSISAVDVNTVTVRVAVVKVGTGGGGTTAYLGVTIIY